MSIWRDNGVMGTHRLFSVMDGDREVAGVALLTGVALEWNEDRVRRTVYQVTPALGGGWDRVRQVSTQELLGALPR